MKLFELPLKKKMLVSLVAAQLLIENVYAQNSTDAMPITLSPEAIAGISIASLCCGAGLALSMICCLRRVCCNDADEQQPLTPQTVKAVAP